MPFVKRSLDGKIVLVAEAAAGECLEEVALDDPALLDFLGRVGGEAGGHFIASDLALIRVLEDVVEVMVRKGQLSLTDLPAAAQEKLLSRRALRGWLAGLTGMVSEDGGKII